MIVCFAEFRGRVKLPVEHLNQCWFLAGPTASGKSAVALCLADTLNAEILALDSMTLYRGMNIGTAKPTAAERQRCPHHLFDLLDPHETFSVAQYLQAAIDRVAEILARGRTPLFVGGTGLYLRALLRGVFDGPPVPAEIRTHYELRAAAGEGETLFRELTQVDPVTAARLHPRDLRRVTRALEVFTATGRPLSDWHAEQPADVPLQHVFWLDPPRVWLHERINSRVDAMFAAGLWEEVVTLSEWPQGISQTARQALGYKEILDALAAGAPDRDDVRRLIQTRTRQFAKRQCTWFRHLEGTRPVQYSGRESAAALAEQILRIADRCDSSPPQPSEPS